MVKVRQILVSKDKYAIKCPNKMTAEFITIHNTANDASAKSEVSYMISNDKAVSFHYAVDDKEIVQAIPIDRNAWHCGDGNGTGNRKSIGVEICYSECGGDLYAKSEENAVQFVAQLLKERGWGTDKVKQHSDWSGKDCPHRIRKEGTWQLFLDRINKALGEVRGMPISQPSTLLDNVAQKPSKTTYRVYANGEWCGWIKGYNDTNANGYAGVVGSPIMGVQIQGDVEYRVRTTDGKWWSWIKGYNTTNSNGYAGTLSKSIDAIQIKNKTYRVGPVKLEYLGWITHYNTTNGNGYAGIYGKPIDRLQIQ